jgi:7-cyano-7-deazaguanine synthase in queuosine biosynthesis
MTTLMFFSGGLDSTAMLVRMLRETDEALIVHRIVLKTNDGRQPAESVAASKLIPLIQYQNRYFKFGSSVQDYRDVGRNNIFDQHIIRWTGAQFCRANAGITKIIWGKCKEDESEEHFARVAQANRIFAEAVAPYYPATWETPNGQMTKKEEIAYLRAQMPELLDHIHYCRYPHSTPPYWNCEKCRTCLHMLDADEELYRRRCKTSD